MKVCLVNPPNSDQKRMDFNEFYAVQHLGIGYICSSLRSNHIDADIIDCSIEEIKSRELVDRITKGRYTTVGFSTYYYNIISVIKVVRLLKAKNPEIFIFLGGYFATMRVQETFNYMPEVDCIIMGEGEISTLKLIQNLKKKDSDWHSVAGIAYLENSKLFINDPPPHKQPRRIANTRACR